MTHTGIGAFDGRAAGAYAHADALASPVRPISPAQPRPRFDLGNLGASPKQPAGEAGRVEDEGRRPSARPALPEAASTARSPSGGYGFTAFLAQSIAQQDDAGAPPPSAFQAGARAYRRQPEDPGAKASVEVLSPFPRLASGRSLDLSV